MIKHSKYYYDYTRNMSNEQTRIHCGRPTCDKEICSCAPGFTTEKWKESVAMAKKKEEIGFDAWIDDLEESEQPSCNMDNPEDCENCGS